jgi:hypothetical protein
MIRLDIDPQPRWIEPVAGVRLQVLPITATVIRRAQAALAEVDDIDTSASDPAWQVEFGKALARQVIVAWDGICGADDKPLPVTPEAINALLDMHPIHECFRLLVLMPALVLVSEGNGSAPSPDGSSAGAPTIAAPATASAPTARH